MTPTTTADTSNPQSIRERVVTLVATLKTLRAEAITANAATQAPSKLALEHERETVRLLEAEFHDAPAIGEEIIKPWIADLVAEAKALASRYHSVQHDSHDAAHSSLRVQLRSLGLRALRDGHAHYSAQERARLVIAVLEDWLSNRCKVQTTGD